MATEIIMVRPNLDNIPDYPLPEGYHMRGYQQGDDVVWAEIWTAVHDFDTVEAALKAHHTDFMPDAQQLPERQLFLCNPQDEVIGTISGWYGNSYEPDQYGLIHWVAIKPEYQAHKLGRPLLCEGMNLLKKWHHKTYLCTHTHRTRAVRVYLDMGFVPFIRHEQDTASWKEVAKQLHHDSLAAYRE